MSMSGEPDAYGWLGSSHLEVAGCVTAIAGARMEDVAKAFGARLQPPGPGASSGQVRRADEVMFSEVPGADDDAGPTGCVVVEDNGFQGLRPEVLRAISSCPGAGKVASVFWNVNGANVFSCADQGDMIAAIELGGSEDEDLSTVPGHLHDLVRVADAPGQDLVSVGAAMVAAYTNVAITPAVLHDGVLATVTPLPDDLDPYVPGDPPVFLDGFPELVDALVSLPRERQRAIAAWAAGAAVAEAGLSDTAAVVAVMDRLGQRQEPADAAALDTLYADLLRQADRIEMDEMDDDTQGGLEGTYVHQQMWATRAVRKAQHSDPVAAAVQTVGDLLGAAACTRTERAVAFIEDEKGRREIDADDPTVDRRRAIASVVEALTAADPGTWPAISTRLPAPLTTEQRDQALARDAQRRSDGEFDEYDILTVDPDGDDDW